MIPIFTTARTTAFIPALSPPDVSTARRILWALGAAVVIVWSIHVSKLGVGMLLGIGDEGGVRR